MSIYEKFTKFFVKAITSSIFFLFIGLVASFYFMIQIPRSPSLIIQESTSEEHVSLPFQFLMHLINFFTGDWGDSNTLKREYPVLDIFKPIIPQMIEIMIGPIVIGILLGRFLGRVSVNTKYKWKENLLRVLFVIGLAMPIFSFAYFLQYQFEGIFPVSGYISTKFESPPFITGFSILDSLIAGKLALTLDILLHFILPTVCLSISITAFIARLTRSNLLNPHDNHSIISNSLQIGMGFNLIFIYYLLIDLTFNLSGFGFYLIMSLWNLDFYIIRGCLFMIIIFFVTINFTLNLIIITFHSILKNQLDLKPTLKTQVDEEEGNLKNKKDAYKLKNFLLNRVKSPFTIVGVIIILLFIVIAIFPQLFTPYSLEEVTPPFLPSDARPYEFPCPDHPLGTAHYGYDFLALLIWSIQDLLIFGLWTVLIGLIGGFPFGFIASKFTRGDRQFTLGIMTLFYIFPNIVIIMLISIIYESNRSVLSFIIGLLLIPMFTHRIANTKPKVFEICREIIIFIPFAIFFTIFLYVSIGFLGFSYNQKVQLGYIIYKSQGHALEHFWFVFWPGLILFILAIGLLLLHEGLKKSSREEDFF